MKCFRCNGLNFDIVKHSLFGMPLVGCSNCNQVFFIKGKLQLNPVEIVGNIDTVESEYLSVKCMHCPTVRYITEHVGMDISYTSCRLCNVETEPIGDKLTWEEFLNSNQNK